MSAAFPFATKPTQFPCLKKELKLFWQGFVLNKSTFSANDYPITIHIFTNTMLYNFL